MTEEHNRRQRIVDAIVFLQLVSLLSLAKHAGRAKSTFELVMLADHDVALLLPVEQSYFAQHFSHNIVRIGLAIDHQGNGYRWLLPMAMSEPALLNAALAVAASHHSRWQQLTNNDALKYLRAPCQSLKQRLVDRKLVHSNVFAGTDRWKRHLLAIHGWIRSRGDCSDLDPFLKNWVCMLDIQEALSLGITAIPELDPWMEATADHKLTIDALFGCSVRLPKLLSAASRLLVAIRDGELVIPSRYSHIYAVGLGANLGWCLVVLGTELETAERRHYIISRWTGLHLLGIHSTKNGEKILNEVWNHRDLMKQGYPVASEPWQDIMLRIGKAQIFI
ncbi:hypothetical protein V2G26_021468 [Clonostachys chloroleuca]